MQRLCSIAKTNTDRHYKNDEKDTLVSDMCPSVVVFDKKGDKGGDVLENTDRREKDHDRISSQESQTSTYTYDYPSSVPESQPEVLPSTTCSSDPIWDPFVHDLLVLEEQFNVSSQQEFYNVFSQERSFNKVEKYEE